MKKINLLDAKYIFELLCAVLTELRFIYNFVKICLYLCS